VYLVFEGFTHVEAHLRPYETLVQVLVGVHGVGEGFVGVLVQFQLHLALVQWRQPLADGTLEFGGRLQGVQGFGDVESVGM